jgi:hypothetical protein
MEDGQAGVQQNSEGIVLMGRKIDHQQNWANFISLFGNSPE